MSCQSIPDFFFPLMFYERAMAISTRNELIIVVTVHTTILQLPYVVFYYCFFSHVYLFDNELVSYSQGESVVGMLISLQFCILWMHNNSILTSQQYYCLFSRLLLRITISSFDRSFLSIMKVFHFLFTNPNIIHSLRQDSIPFSPRLSQNCSMHI